VLTALLDCHFRNYADIAFPVAGAAVDAFLLVYLISAVAKADGLGGAECPACLAAYTPVTNVVNLGSFGCNACLVRLGFSGFGRSH
jgi:hypothetical protein